MAASSSIMENFQSMNMEKLLGMIRDRRVQCGVAASVVTLFVLQKLTQKKPNLPPGPSGWPLVGNMFGKRIIHFQSLNS